MLPVNRILFQVFSVLMSIVFYLYCFYVVKSPFACGYSEMNDCQKYWPNHIWLWAALNVLVYGSPGVFFVLVISRYTVALVVWLCLFSAWTFFLHINFIRGIGIDGQNGCEFCDFTMIFMMFVSYTLFFTGITIVVVRFIIRRDVRQS